MDKYGVSQVFVPVGLPDITFVNRANLERSVKSWEMNKAKHLLIFGPSKSGKTSLWKKYLAEDNVIKIPCNAQKMLSDVYSDILFELNSFYTPEKEKTLQLKVGLLAELKSMLGVFSSKAQLTTEATQNTSEKQRLITTPIVGANLVVRFLKPSRKIIVLEDFHYASDDFKMQLSQDLKAFSDDECPWIIVGIQHKTSKLLAYNMDLQQRIAEIPVEGFTMEQLKQIIELGELALNIEFSPGMKDRIIEEAFGSASLVQNICQRICIISNINETIESTFHLDSNSLIETACKDIAYENKNYYDTVIKNVARGGRSDGSTEKYKWFLKLIRDKEIPELGLRNTEIFAYIKGLGHEGIEQGSVTSGLSYLPTLLNKLGFPAFFDYDSEKKQFYLLDKYMKFVFKWIPEMIDELFNAETSQLSFDNTNLL